MSVLQIFLFGNPRIIYDHNAPEFRLTRTPQALLAYLLLHRHRYHPREVLASLFWANHSDDQARSCLSTTLWRLRSALEPKVTSYDAHLITASPTEIGINQESHFWLDISTFEDQVNQAFTAPNQATTRATVQKVEQALQLYTGDLLEGFYDDWILRERERLRELYLSSLTHLMRYYQQQQVFEQSLIYAQQILQHDPLREDIHREVIRLYVENRQPALAVRQYQLLCKVLERELNVLPMPETQALYAHITSTYSYQRAESGGVVDPPTLQQALQQLQQAKQNFEEAQKKLQQAIQLVEQLTKL